MPQLTVTQLTVTLRQAVVRWVWRVAWQGVAIMSYDLALKMSEELRSVGFGVIVADESHILKNGASGRSKVNRRPLCRRACLAYWLC